MSDPLFERYKEALKVGHVAVLQGRLEDALEQYRTASTIAAERPLPHASMGGVLLRLGRAEEALACYARALERAPDYEVAAAGRAEALVAVARNAEAADAIERLAEIRLIAGQPEEAREAFRRALALHDTDSRRRNVERVERLVEERAVSSGAVRDVEEGGGPVGSGPPPDHSPSWPAEGEEIAPPGSRDGDRATDVLRLMIPGAAAAGAGEPIADEEVAGGAEPVGGTGIREEDAPATAEAAEALLGEAERLAATGEMEVAVDALVRAADAFLAADATDAATDACQRALDLAPGSPDVHLALVRLYLATGSRDLAAEKLLLLGRLLDLGGTREDRERVVAVIHETFAGDSRFEAPPA